MINVVKPSIAIIEDSDDLREELNFFLQAKGYDVWSEGSAEAFWKQLHLKTADIVLVDIGLPGEDGFNVVEHLAKMAHFGLIIISARGAHEDNVRGLNSGADLYLVKPISFSHLVSSIDALWHRLLQSKDQATPQVDVNNDTGDCWLLDEVQRMLVSPSGQLLKLSQQEYNLVAVLSASATEVFPRETLHNILFHYEEDTDDHRIDVILSRLRKKAREQNFKLPIHSIFGKGLVFTGRVMSSFA